jgi:hypothetical protein
MYERLWQLVTAQPLLIRGVPQTVLQRTRDPGARGDRSSGASSSEAVDWAVDEAVRHDVPLHLVHAAAPNDEALSLTAAASERARKGTPAVPLSSEVLHEYATSALVSKGRNVFALVLGSRGLGDLAGAAPWFGQPGWGSPRRLCRSSWCAAGRSTATPGSGALSSVSKAGGGKQHSSAVRVPREQCSGLVDRFREGARRAYLPE